MAWKKIEKKGGGRSGGAVNYAVRVSRMANNKLSVTLSESMLRRLKWKQGDRVHLLIDQQNNMLGLQRTTDLSGRTLTAMSGGNSAKRTKTKHAVVRGGLTAAIIKRCVNGSPREFSVDEVIIDDQEDIVAIELLSAGG
jgi:hypothetical protein